MTNDERHNLINIHPLRPIRSDDELDWASVVLNTLLDREELTPDEADYLEVLGSLIERYEREVHPISRGTDAEMLRFLIENKGVSPAEVAAQTQMTDSTLAAILAGEQTIAPPQVAAFAHYFHVAPEVFAPVARSRA